MRLIFFVLLMAATKLSGQKISTIYRAGAFANTMDSIEHLPDTLPVHILVSYTNLDGLPAHNMNGFEVCHNRRMYPMDSGGCFYLDSYKKRLSSGLIVWGIKIRK